MIGIIALILLGLILVFIAAPSVTMFFILFSRKEPRPYTRQSLETTYYAPYIDRMEEAAAFVSALEHREVCVFADDGTELRGEYFPNRGERLAVFAHGFNSRPLSNFAVQAAFLRKEGFDLLMPWQRAHGKSGGRFVSFGVLESYDLLRWLDWARANSPAGQALVYGTSMGCAAVSLASDKADPAYVKGMVLDCGFNSPKDQIICDSKRRHLPWRLMLPWVLACGRIFLRCDLRMSGLDSLRRTSIPALLLHGTADDVVELSQSENAFEACASQKQLIIVPDAGHTAAFMTGGETTEKALRDFINNYFQEETGEKI